MRHLYLSFIFLLTYAVGFSQDITYAKQLIDTLASPTMQGRGYVNAGDRLAAEFIKSEMQNMELKPLFASESYHQSFLQDVNTFPEEVLLQFGSKKLVPGRDFLVHPYSGKVTGTFTTMLVRVAADMDGLTQKLSGLKKQNRTAVVLYAETADEYKKALSALGECFRKTDLVILVNPSKLTWSVSDEEHTGKAVFEVRKDAFTALKKTKTVKVKTEPVFVKNYESRNVAGFVPGEIKDTFLLLTAHYDHLGKMGGALFPGANDNASGTAMLLNLAKFYAGNTKRPKYTLVFIAFAGEEAGLKGSRFFTENPAMPLASIRFVFNIDLMGGGTAGSTIVNGSLYEKEFDRITAVNAQHGLLPQVKKRGKAANSDHYWFSEKGVPAFFMYAEGGVTAYHDVDDTREKLPLTKYNELFRLIHLFVDGF